MSDLPDGGALKDNQLTILHNAGIVVTDDHIVDVGEYESLQSKYPHAEKQLHSGVVLPGLIDAHTHLCWGGSRADDYARRNAGMSYLEIAQHGGGIWSSVQKTRNATLEELTALTAKRANLLLQAGITTIEVKSGYGLSVEHELKQLRAIKEAQKLTCADLIPTCLAAHIKPKDFEGTHMAYLDYLSQELFPILQSEQLTNRIDAFVEEGAFTAEQITPYFELAKKKGFEIVVHADQFHAGGSAVAAQLGALSADHLEASDDQAIDQLIDAGVVAVALPGATMGLGCDWAPGRKILDAGGVLAIASDWNPGSAPMGDLLTQAAVYGAFQKLSNAEVLAGITFRAAKALKLSDRGAIVPGTKADFIAFNTSDYREVLYQQGRLKPASVWKNGLLITPIKNHQS